MKNKISNIIETIKNNKRAKVLTISCLLLIFVISIGVSLSYFTNNTSNSLTNMTINGLNFYITSNASSIVDDRIIKIDANTLESFDVDITNLNNVDIRYELLYDVCTDSTCSSTQSLPSDVSIGLDSNYKDKYTGTISSNSITTIKVLTENKTSNVYYVKFKINAGYSWNSLSLVKQLQEFENDINITISVNGTASDSFPSDCLYSTSYTTSLDGVATSDEVKLTCDPSTNKWTMSTSVVNSDIAINFTKILISDYLIYLYNKGNTSYLKYDGTTEFDSNVSYYGTGNLRYYGPDTTSGDVPNYVYLEEAVYESSTSNIIITEDVLYRIIGVFKVYNNISGKWEKVVKVIRSEPFAKVSWDTSSSSVNAGYGTNSWVDSDLFDEFYNLGEFLDKGTSLVKWYNGPNSSTVTVESRGYMEIWRLKLVTESPRYYLGSFIGISNKADLTMTAEEMYKAERSGVVTVPGTTCSTSSDCNDTYTRKGYYDASFFRDGGIGLMYPSDYAFAAKDVSTSLKCSNSIFTSNNYCGSSYNWLSTGKGDWTITQYIHPSNSTNVIFIGTNGAIGWGRAAGAANVRPVLYLNVNAKYSTGDGTKDNPYRVTVE